MEQTVVVNERIYKMMCLALWQRGGKDGIWLTREALERFPSRVAIGITDVSSEGCALVMKDCVDPVPATISDMAHPQDSDHVAALERARQDNSPLFDSALYLVHCEQALRELITLRGTPPFTKALQYATELVARRDEATKPNLDALQALAEILGLPSEANVETDLVPYARKRMEETKGALNVTATANAKLHDALDRMTNIASEVKGTLHVYPDGGKRG